MPTRVVERFSSRLTPWEVFQNLYAEENVCFFLDSVQHRKPDQNYSYLAGGPYCEIELEAGASLRSSRLRFTGSQKGPLPVSSEWPALMRSLLKAGKTQGRQNMPFFSGGAVGYCSYDLAQHLEKKLSRLKHRTELPLFHFGFFRDLIVYDHKKSVYWLVTHKGAGLEPPKKAIQRLKSFFRKPAPLVKNVSIRNFKPGISRPRFETMVRRAKKYIEAGDIYQANLSQRFSFECRSDRLSLYDELRKINPSPFSSFLKFRDLEIISSSPERLVSKRGRLCETRPIAGTRPRPRAEKLSSVKKELLANEKERAEHIMLVDLERNDLGRVCDWPTVRVEEMMKIEKYSHVLHIVSKITGRLQKDKDALDLLSAMFPGGTVTGCPKIRCMEIIDELEPCARGLYTGSIGYLDFSGDMDMNIVIRTLILKGRRGYLQVGAGIVHDSNPRREYEETLHKGEALFCAMKKKVRK